MGQLGLAMRPDHSGILLRVQDGPAIVFQPTGGLEALLAMPAMELLGSLVSSDIATYISMPGKPGHTNVVAERRSIGRHMKEVFHACNLN